MTSFKNQAGGALIGYMILAAVGAGLAAIYGINKMKADYEIQVINDSALKMEQIQSAHLQCYNDLRRWCTESEIIGFYEGEKEIIGGDRITHIANGANLTFSVNTYDESRAKRLSQLVSSSEIVDTIVRSTIRPPTDASIYSERLQRYANAIDSDRIIMATDFDMGGNDVNNAENVFAETLNIGTTIVDTLNANTTIVSSELDIGGNRIVSVGSDINIYATTVKPSGTVTLEQNLLGTDTSIMSGFTNADGDAAIFESATTDTLTAENGNFNTVDVDVATSEVLTATTGNIANSNITNLTFNNAIGSSLNTSSLDINYTITGTQITATDATIGTVNSTTAIVNTATLNDLTATNTTTNDLTATSAQFVNLNSVNTFSDIANSGHVIANSGNIGALIATNLTGNSGVATSAIATNLSTPSANISDALTGNVINADLGAINLVNATDLDATAANSVIFTNVTTNNVDTGTLIGDNATINDVVVNGTLISDTIIAEFAAIALLETQTATINSANFYTVDAANGTAYNTYSNSFNATDASIDNISADRIDAEFASIDTFRVDTVDAANSTFSTANASSFSGDQFNADGDFYTAQSSVNANAGDYRKLSEDLNNCINVTKFCIPQTPEVTISCPACVQRDLKSNFDATATAIINNCSKGCDYEWITAGPGLTFSGCTSGTVPAGGSASSFCKVNATVNASSFSTGLMQIAVKNTDIPTLQNSANVNVHFENQTAINPFVNIAGGCFVDTAAFDIATHSNCVNPNHGEDGAEYTVVFSVGESLGNESFGFNNASDFDVTWTGDCNAISHTCLSVFNDTKPETIHSATALVTHIPSNEQQTFVVRVISSR
jgi:hypothetical protein